MDDKNIGRVTSNEQYGAPSQGSASRNVSTHSVAQHNNGYYGKREINFIFFFRAALRRWRIMLLCLLLGVTGGFIYIHNAVRIYAAEAVVEMNVRRPRVISDSAVYEDAGMGRDTDVIFNTRFEKFRSPAMEEIAVREFFKRFPESASPDNPSAVGKYSLPALIRDVYWWKDPSANIVRVSFYYHHPQFAANLVNVLSDCAGILMREENQAQSDEAVKWLMDQVEEQRESLEGFEKQLANIREEVQIDAIQQRKEAISQTIISVSEEREALISRLAERRTIYDFVSDLQEIDPNLEMLPTGLPKEEQFNEMIRAWRDAFDAFQQMSGRYTALHPEYRLAEERELRTRKRLEQFIESSSKAVQNEMDLLERQIEQIADRIDNLKKESSILEQQLVAGLQKVQALERKRDAADNAFQNMLQRTEEARAAADENMAFTKVIRYAGVPRVPVSPKKSTALIFSVIIGSFIGLLIVVVIELWTDTIGSVSELRSLNLNIMGVIPTQKKLDSRGELATIGLRDKFNSIVETFSGINALLSSERYAAHSRVLLLCSIMPGEGKTIAACNLAISSALNGAKTLLIEGDLRRPQLLNIFAISDDHPSLLEWLVDGDSHLEHGDLISKGVIENLDVIPSKPIADINPSELLRRGRLTELLEWARNNYDRVIIDSPPLGPVGDAQVFANFADGVILVSRMGKTRWRMLKLTLNRLSEIDAQVLGCIANDVPQTLTGMFNGAEGYGYGYGYGRGYESHGRVGK